MNDIKIILSNTFHQEDWRITKPQDGQQKECYIAESPNVKVFIKFDVVWEPLLRLSELDVSPKLLTHGVFEGRPYIIQEFLYGIYPDRQWIKEHSSVITRVMKTYHEDKELMKLLRKNNSSTYEGYIKHEYTLLQDKLSLITDRYKIASLFDTFVTQALHLEGQLVSTHNEPNIKNMLVVKEKLFFIDWDEIALADPFRDIGPFLWWYLPEGDWSTFLQQMDIQETYMNKEKVYWFAARASLTIALWLAERNKNPGQFVQDFITAMQRKENSHT